MAGAEQRIELAGLPEPTRGLFELAGDLAERRGERLAWVGGGVRDLLLGRSSLDLDLVLEGDLEAFARDLAARSGARARSLSRFLTVTLTLTDGTRLDLVRARRESYRGAAALPEVEAASLREDLNRRDFTINAIAVRLTPRGRRGELVDPLGGRDDLAGARLRVLHGRSFEDDPSRLLRGLRFALRFGFHLEPETAELARAAAAGPACAALSGARLARELRLLFVDHSALGQAIGGLSEWRLLAAFMPGLVGADAARRAAALAGDLLAAAARLRPAAATLDGWRLGLLALAGPLEVEARLRLAARLALNAAERELVVAGPTRAETAADRLRADGLAAHQAEALLAPLSPEELVLVAAQGGASESWVARYLSELRRLRLRVSAGDLLAAGAAPGPALGGALRALRAARLDGEIGPESELEFALEWLERSAER